MMWLIAVPAYAAFVFVAYRVEQMLARRWDMDRSLADKHEEHRHDEESRRIALEEQKFERLNRASHSEPMPRELEDRINAWEDEWARDDERRNILALYAEHGNWETVKSILRPIA